MTAEDLAEIKHGSLDWIKCRLTILIKDSFFIFKGFSLYIGNLLGYFDMEEHILAHSEVEVYVSNLTPSKIDELGGLR